MKKLKKYIITLLIGFAAVALILWSKDLFSQTQPAMIYHILCDAFFATGVVMTGIGLLIFTTNEGVFDGLVYGVGSFIDMFRKTSRKKYHTLYDYKESRADKKLTFGHVVLCGLLFIAVSLVMFWLYSQAV